MYCRFPQAEGNPEREEGGEEIEINRKAKSNALGKVKTCSEEGEQASPFQFISDFQSWAEYQVLKFFEYGHSSIREYLFWTLIPALAFLLYRIFRSSRRHRKDDGPQPVFIWPGLDSEFYRLERKLVQNGIPRRSGETLTAWMQRATGDERLAELKGPLENVLQLHYRYRFDPRGLNPSERLALRRLGRYGEWLSACPEDTGFKPNSLEHLSPGHIRALESYFRRWTGVQITL